MRVLLDEDVPVQTLEALKHVLRGHAVSHVLTVGWSGKSDVNLYRDAASRFEAIVTNNHRQLNDPDELDAIRKSKLHHISYGQREQGMHGLALSIGAIIAAMPMVIDELAKAPGQRFVHIKDLDPKRRYEITDPMVNPPKYWRR